MVVGSFSLTSNVFMTQAALARGEILSLHHVVSRQV